MVHENEQYGSPKERRINPLERQERPIDRITNSQDSLGAHPEQFSPIQRRGSVLADHRSNDKFNTASFNVEAIPTRNSSESSDPVNLSQKITPVSPQIAQQQNFSQEALNSALEALLKHSLGSSAQLLTTGRSTESKRLVPVTAWMHSTPEDRRELVLSDKTMSGLRDEFSSVFEDELTKQNSPTIKVLSTSATS